MVKLQVVVLLAALLAPSALARPRAACSVSVNNDLGDPQPLLLKPGLTGTGHDAYYQPNPSGGDSIEFQEGETLHLACPGGELRITGATTGSETGDAVCSGGKSFTINGKTVPFSQLTCTKQPFHEAKYTGVNCAGTNYKEIEVGFQIETSQRFLRVLRICFDDVAQTTIYSEFNLTRSIGGYQSGFPRPSFIEDDFYNLGTQKLDTLYSRNTQRTTVNALVGLAAGSTKYVHASNDYFMSRGHMTAKADFVYGAQHRATFHFVNVAPQWQTFNGANWNTLEMNVRSFAGGRDTDLVVFTGGHGVTTLPHETTGADIPLYLYRDSNGNSAIPVPQVYWKVVYDQTQKAGIAFVGINNPYHTDVSDEIFCVSVCDQVNWLSWDSSSISKGYSYCCDVDELRQVITDIPALDVQQLLVK